MRRTKQIYVALFVFGISVAGPGFAQYEFDLTPMTDTVQDILPEGIAVFRFSLANTGTPTDTFSLRIPPQSDSFPSDEWFSQIWIGEVWVPPAGTGCVDLMPDSADTTIQVHIHTYSLYPSWGTGRTTLFVRSVGDPTLRDSVNVWVTVQQFGCGDCNGDGRVTISDATYLVGFIYKAGPAPVGSGDVNRDGRFTVADAAYVVAYIYRGGPEPCSPPFGYAPITGEERTGDDPPGH